jgi:hypothetical protein
MLKEIMYGIGLFLQLFSIGHGPDRFSAANQKETEDKCLQSDCRQTQNF